MSVGTNINRFWGQNNMRKLKLQMQITVDGFVAGPNGELDWMTFGEDDQMWEQITELTDSSDTILMGRKMTDGFVNYWTSVLDNPESPEYSFAQKMVNIPKVVFSKTVKESKWANTTVADGDLFEEIEKLKQQDGKDIIVYGGAAFVSNLVKENLIDEYYFFVNPVAIGKGLSIFGKLEGTFPLKLIETKQFDCGETLMSYAKKGAE
jgi:dihydrofolate reductase